VRRFSGHQLKQFARDAVDHGFIVNIPHMYLLPRFRHPEQLLRD
jgi:hypothetical protein